MVPNLNLIPDLIAVLTFPSNIILVKPPGLFLSSTSKVICHVFPLHPPPLHYRERRGSLHGKNLSRFSSSKKRSPGPNIILSFLSLIPSPHSSFYKNLPFHTTLQSSLLVARWDGAQFTNCLIKPIRSSS